MRASHGCADVAPVLPAVAGTLRAGLPAVVERVRVFAAGNDQVPTVAAVFTAIGGNVAGKKGLLLGDGREEVGPASAVDAGDDARNQFAVGGIPGLAHGCHAIEPVGTEMKIPVASTATVPSGRSRRP